MASKDIENQYQFDNDNPGHKLHSNLLLYSLIAQTIFSCDISKIILLDIRTARIILLNVKNLIQYMCEL